MLPFNKTLTLILTDMIIRVFIRIIRNHLLFKTLKTIIYFKILLSNKLLVVRKV